MATERKKKRGTELAYLAPFGAYLREIRQRKGLSLADVESLSERSSDPINKGYLSRVENGQQSIAFSKLITLARIYDCPPGALVDRLELDMEAASVEVPEFDSMEACLRWSRQRSNRGEPQHSYAAVRNYRLRSTLDSEKHRLTVTLTTPAIFLGKYEYTEFELKTELSVVDSENSEHLSFLHERLATLFFRRENYIEANRHSSKALELAKDSGSADRIFHAHYAHATGLLQQKKFREAIDELVKAYELSKEFEDSILGGKVLSSLASAYLGQKQFAAARRAITAAQKNFRTNKARASQALLSTFLGQIEFQQGDYRKAEIHYRDSLDLLKGFSRHRFRFFTEIRLLELAVTQGNQAMARAVLRRLKRLRPWFPKEAELERDYGLLETELHARNMLDR